MTPLFPRQLLTIASSAGRFVLPPLVILPQTSRIEVRIPRPTTLTPRAFGNADRIRVQIIVEIDGVEYHCTGQATGGIRVGRLGELPEYVLCYGLPWGFFDFKEGFPVRLGERVKTAFTARVEITSLDGAIDSEIEVIGFDAPAPRIAFHSSVAFDAATDAQEVAGDGIISLTHTTTGANTSVFAGSGNDATAGRLTTSISYGGTNMTELWDIIYSTAYGNSGYHWPGGSTVPSGAQTVTCTLSAAPNEQALGVISMTGVDQTAPVGTPATANGTASPASVTVGGVGADDMVVDNLYGNMLVPTVGADQILRYEENVGGGGFFFLDGSTQLGSAGGVMSWTSATMPDWGYGAVAFKAAVAVVAPNLKGVPLPPALMAA